MVPLQQWGEKHETKFEHLVIYFTIRASIFIRESALDICGDIQVGEDVVTLRPDVDKQLMKKLSKQDVGLKYAQIRHEVERKLCQKLPQYRKY